MRKKRKDKTKNPSKKITRKASSKNANDKELNPEELRKDLAKMVEAEAEDLAHAVIEEGKKGQLATVKYLFEMAHIFPQPPEGTVSNADEESLAKTLLDRLNVPDQPVVHDLYERGEEVMVIAPRAQEAEKPQAQASAQDGQKESVPAGVE